MSGNYDKDSLTYDAAETVYLPEEEQEAVSRRDGRNHSTESRTEQEVREGQTERKAWEKQAEREGRAQRRVKESETERKAWEKQTEREVRESRTEQEVREGQIEWQVRERQPIRQAARPESRGAMLSQDISLGKFYVPAGSFSRSKGGQAQVYDCYIKGETFPPGESDYVAKVYNPPANQREERALERTKEVNRTLLALTHPNLPKLYAAADSDEGGHYMVVMRKYEPYDGFLAFESFAGNRRLFERMFLEAVEGLHGALCTLHERHIFHADIKPANIMQYRDRYGSRQPVLIDFGIGVKGENIDTKVGVAALGKTDFYLPPELYNMKRRKVNQYTDYYSFGMTMAEFVAGRYPMRNNMRDREEDRAYAGRNQDSTNQFYGLLLPEGLPDYLARFFEGTLYAGNGIPIEELYRRRWASRGVSEWLSAVRERDYRRARAIPTGRQIEAEEAKKAGPGVSVKYDSEEAAIVLHSTEEMAMMFLTHWEETVEKLLHSAGWSRIFSKLGEDVSALLEQTRQSMQADLENRERIFDRMLMETYLPDQIRKEGLRYQNLFYRTRKELGQNLYAILLQEKKTTKGRYRLPEKGKAKKRDLFHRAMEMFASGTAERFFQSHREDWRIGNREVSLEKKVRESLRKRDKTEFVENLYRLSFCLQGGACFQTEGLGKIYRRNRQFLKDFRQLYQSETEKAAALLEECFDENDCLRIDYYVFLQEAPDVAQRPEQSMRESLKQGGGNQK